MKNTLLLTAVFSALAAAAGAMTYTVDRTIESGSVSGFIQTDGTLGLLADDNFVDWEITLTSDNLFGGSPQTITGTTGSVQVLGNALSASATEISFNFSVAESSFLIIGSSSAWCMTSASTVFTCLFESIDVSEGIYPNPTGTGPAELVARSGVVTLATPVPLPAGLPLMVAALGGFVITRWRKGC